MIKLSYAISKVLIDEYGQQEFLRRERERVGAVTIK
jgi:hypothetical protein